MKKIESKNFKKIFFIIMLLSVSLFITSISELMYGYDISLINHSWIINNGNKKYARDFYESAELEGQFLQENLLRNIALYTSDVEDHSEQALKNAKGELDILSDIKIYAVNNNTDKVYTNTKYKSIADFNANQKYYCKIEINTKDSNVLYSKTINSEKESISTADESIFWGIYGYDETENHNLDIAITFPKEPLSNENSFNGNLPYLYEGFNRSRASVDTLIFILITSFIATIVAFIGYKKNKSSLLNKESKWYNLYSKLPIEINILPIIIIILFNINIIFYGDFGTSLPFKINDIVVKSLLIFIILVIYSIFIVNFFNLDKKKDILERSIVFNICKFFFKGSSNIIRYQKKFTLIKRLLLIDFIIIIISSAITLVLYSRWFWQDPLLMLLIINVIVVGGLATVTLYIVNKLSYLDKIMKGTEEIKNGRVDYKIDVKGNDCFTNLAENINNLGDGIYKAIDEKFKSERMKTELITNVSHDLKTPLTSILNYVDLIKREENIEPEYLKDYVNILDNKSKRLKVLIEDLFEASKASSGNIELNMEKLDLSQLLRQSIGENEEKLSDANLILKVNIPKEPVYVNCDGKRMYRVLENLLVNISKYALENTRVYIDIKEVNEKVVVSMKNISAYELNFEAEEITERFRRGDLARNTEGSGLGLAIARDLVELQGGRFNIEIDADLFKVNMEFNKL